MCGILFYLGGERLNKNHSSLEVIKHRGPDNVGVEHFSVFKKKITLGHRRLSIIDLKESANQPMNLIHSDLWITYNGELYNYKQLKDELEKDDFVFVTNSDTEVLLASYKRWGEGCLSHFNGMFAFVIWDNSKKHLFVARDRYGIKPLYFWNTKKGFGISSEIKQLAELDHFERKLNYDAAFQFLEYGNFSYDNNTMWEGVFELEPGSCFSIDFCKWKMGDVFKINRWYTPIYKSNERQSIPEKEARGQFYKLFKDSLLKRLQADVDIGALISGGMDSTSIVSMITKKKLSKYPIQTFSIIYDEKEYSEDYFINIVNDCLGIESTSYTFNYSNYFEQIDKVIWHNDLPTVGRSIFSHYYLYQKINSKKYKVILEGQGADEYLAGYSSFHMAHMTGLLKEFKFLNFFKSYKGFKETRVGTLKSDMKAMLKITFPKLFRVKQKGSSFFNFTLHKESVIGRNQNTIEQVHKTRFQILRSILHSVDRVSMANSIETRVPFLDHKLVEYAIQLPFKYKINKGVRKYILRESMKNVIPNQIYKRQDKMGFSSPEELWLKNNLKNIFQDELKEVEKIPFVNSKSVDEYLQLFLNGEVDLDKALIRLINFNHWLKIFKIKF